MPDMLVKLYDLPDLQPALDRQRAQGITIRRGMPPEKLMVTQWVGKHFNNDLWVSETDVAFSTHPTTVILAHRGDDLLGFACYDTTHKGFFGPTGVNETERGHGIGTALLLMALHEMRHAGYMYGIIGWAGPTLFYEKAVNAVAIPDTEPPGSYRGVLGTHETFFGKGKSDPL
jgi:GNAT superfamily N-acetyltransferase